MKINCEGPITHYHEFKIALKHRKQAADTLKISHRYASPNTMSTNWWHPTGFHFYASNLATNHRFVLFQMIKKKKNCTFLYLAQHFRGCFLLHSHINEITIMKKRVWVWEDNSFVIQYGFETGNFVSFRIFNDWKITFCIFSAWS